MTTELLAAIAADPDDDAPRLVYADWLMQRGDPRGELIALQCRIARADAADEIVDDEIIARERALREAHAEAWTAPLREIVDAGYAFRRGFVEHVVVWREREIAPSSPESADAAERLADLVAAAPLLRSIAVRGAALNGSLPAAWSRFRAVTLLESVPSAAAMAAFLARHASSLRHLHLVNAELGEAVTWIGTMPSVEHLGLRAGWHTTKPGPELVDQLVANPALRGLRSLDLAGFAVGDLERLACLQTLERLALHRCGVSIGNVIELASRLPALQMLEIDDDDRKLGQASARAIEALLAGVPNLRRLAVRSWGIKTAGAIAIAKSPHAASLRRLELDGCELRDGGAKALLDSEHLRGVVWLRVADATIGKETQALLDARHRFRYEVPASRYPREVSENIPDNKIGAIKAYREITGAGLADSKMAIDRIVEERGLGPCAGSERAAKFLRATTRWCGA